MSCQEFAGKHVSATSPGDRLQYLSLMQGKAIPGTAEVRPVLIYNGGNGLPDVSLGDPDHFSCTKSP